MSDAAKLGVVALLLWLGGTVLAVRVSEPAGLAMIAISFILGCLAEWRGSKWWLSLPFAMLVELLLGLYVAMRAV